MFTTSAVCLGNFLTKGATSYCRYIWCFDIPILGVAWNVHTTPEKFENAALFLWLGLPSTLIRENGTFRKRFSDRRNLKTPALRFGVERKHFKNGAFRKRRHFPDRVFLKHKSKMTGDCCVFKFLRRSVDENIWCVFRVNTPFSNSPGVLWTGLESVISCPQMADILG